MCCNASRGSQSVKGGRVVPAVSLYGREGLANGFIVEESKDPVLDNRTANAPAKLIEVAVVSRDGQARTVELLVSVQARLVTGKEKAAMEIVGTTLRSDLNLCSAEPPIFGVIVIGDDFYVLD